MMLYCPVAGSSLAGWYRGGTDRVLTVTGGPLPAGDRWHNVQITPTDCRMNLTSLSWSADASFAPLSVPGSSAGRAALGWRIALLPPPPPPNSHNSVMPPRVRPVMTASIGCVRRPRCLTTRRLRCGRSALSASPGDRCQSFT